LQEALEIANAMRRKDLEAIEYLEKECAEKNERLRSLTVTVEWLGQ
jgi:hypothetical protein